MYFRSDVAFVQGQFGTTAAALEFDLTRWGRNLELLVAVRAFRRHADILHGHLHVALATGAGKFDVGHVGERLREI